MDLVKALCRRWGGEFAKRPRYALDEWRAVVEEWPQRTAEPAPRVLAIGSASSPAALGPPRNLV